MVRTGWFCGLFATILGAKLAKSPLPRMAKTTCIQVRNLHEENLCNFSSCVSCALRIVVPPQGVSRCIHIRGVCSYQDFKAPFQLTLKLVSEDAFDTQFAIHVKRGCLKHGKTALWSKLAEVRKACPPASEAERPLLLIFIYLRRDRYLQLQHVQFQHSYLSFCSAIPIL